MQFCANRSFLVMCSAMAGHTPHCNVFCSPIQSSTKLIRCNATEWDGPQVHRCVRKDTQEDYAVKVIDKTSLSSHEKFLLRGEIGERLCHARERGREGGIQPTWTATSIISPPGFASMTHGRTVSGRSTGGGSMLPGRTGDFFRPSWMSHRIPHLPILLH